MFSNFRLKIEVCGNYDVSRTVFKIKSLVACRRTHSNPGNQTAISDFYFMIVLKIESIRTQNPLIFSYISKKSKFSKTGI